MTVRDVATTLNAAVHGAPRALENPVLGGYASDLLSDVIAHAGDGDVWITMQKHVNTVAVAQLRSLAAIVIVNGREPDADAVARATEHGVILLTTSLPAFEAAGRLHELGIRGSRTP
jgi:hypothetical protein